MTCLFNVSSSCHILEHLISASHRSLKKVAHSNVSCVHVQTLESELFLETGKLLTLSEQAYVNCVDNPDHCGGTGK